MSCSVCVAKVTSYWASPPSVTWLSMSRSGSQALYIRSQARISGVSAFR